MNHNLQITVLMPAHNAGRTIRFAIKSTLLAIPKGSFLYVYLDACNDDTASVVKDIEDERLRIFEGTQQRGVAGSLNYLLEVVDTDLVARMDADDICLPTRFRRQLKILRSTNADFIFQNAVLFGKTVRPLGLLPQPPLKISKEFSAKELTSSNPFVHPTLLAKTKSIRQLGGYHDLPAEDYHMWLDASLAGMTLIRGRSYGILYRIHAGQLTRQTKWQNQLAADTALENKIRALYVAKKPTGSLSSKSKCATMFRIGVRRLTKYVSERFIA